jgi:hypothetical protein
LGLRRRRRRRRRRRTPSFRVGSRSVVAREVGSVSFATHHNPVVQFEGDTHVLSRE